MSLYLSNNWVQLLGKDDWKHDTSEIYYSPCVPQTPDLAPTIHG